MLLPKNILTNTYTKPNIYLCEVDKTRMCLLETTDTQASFKFNSYSEISFEVARVYNDLITGETKVNPYYDKIEALRLIEVEDIGFFEIQGPTLTSDGIKESKSVTTYSFEYTLSQKYLEEFYTANGRDDWVGSLEDIWQEKNDLIDSDTVPSIVLYNPNDVNASVLHLILEKAYGWSIGHVDESLWNLKRDFDVDRTSIYDFLMTDVCEKYNCYVTFDTIKNEINVYAQSPTSRFIGDGNTNVFYTLPFSEIETVAVNGYKTSKWKYTLGIDPETGKVAGIITLDETPPAGIHVEVVGDVTKEWETDVFVTFDNLSQEITVDYDAESIKTVLTVEYGEEQNIREVNLGLPYITDISYYNTPDWMGQELYDAYAVYSKKMDDANIDFQDMMKEWVLIKSKIAFEELRMALNYTEIEFERDVTPHGVYYTRGGDQPDYFYLEVNLPRDFEPGKTYFKIEEGMNFNEEKMEDFFGVIQSYFNDNEDWEKDYDDMIELKSFEFVKGPITFVELKEKLKKIRADQDAAEKLLGTKKAIAVVDEDEDIYEDEDTDEDVKPSIETIRDEYADLKAEAITEFLDVLWEQLGKKPLNDLYLEPYKERQQLYLDSPEEVDEDGNIITPAGNWSNRNHENYWMYYPITFVIESIEDAISIRENTISEYEDQVQEINDKMKALADSFAIKNNFTEQQQIRLSAFLREDELTLDDIIETNLDNTDIIFKTKQDAMEAGRLELKKLSQPQLQFSMTMANIYALPEFAPIVHKFQLGNVIKVGIRKDYIKQSRLMQVDMSFDDFSSFLCVFGELTTLRTQSDIHADLLQGAVTAGQTVATNASYWTKGADVAAQTDLKLQQGLLDANTQIRAVDGTQDVVIDKYGIHMQKKNPSTGEIDPEQAWFVNNSLMFTSDGWRTSRAGIGKFDVEIDGVKSKQYGVIADAVLAGYIEGSHMRGGDIRIGQQEDNKDIYAFRVDNNGDFNFGGEHGISYDSAKKKLNFGTNVSLNWNQITDKDDLPTIDDVTTKITDIIDNSGFVDFSEAVTIAKDTITAPYLKTLNLEVGNEIKMGENAKLTWSNLPEDAVSSEDAVTITKDTISGEYIKGLSLEVGKEIQMAEDAVISWNNLPEDVNSMEKMVQISKDTIDAPFIKGLNLTVGEEISMGENALITWANLPDDVVSNDDISDYTTLEEVKTYTAKNVWNTQIGKDWIRTADLIAGNLKMCGSIYRSVLIEGEGSSSEIITAPVEPSLASVNMFGINTLADDATSGDVDSDTPSDKDDTGESDNDDTGADSYIISSNLLLGINKSKNLQLGYSKDDGYNNIVISAPKNVTISSSGNTKLTVKPTGGSLSGKWYIDGYRIYNSQYAPASLRVLNGTSTTRGVIVFKSSVSGNYYFAPSQFGKSDVCRLGSNTDGRRWSNLYVKSGTVSTSDRNMKNTISPISDKYEQMFNDLKPVSYKFNDGTRTHIGFISQDVEDSMSKSDLTDMDFAGFCKDIQEDESYAYALRYEEFIALNTHMIQKQQKIIDELLQRIEVLERK